MRVRVTTRAGRFLRLGFVVFALTLVGGCETARIKTEEAPAAAVSVAERAERAGEYLIAAREYENLAAGATAPQKQLYQMGEVDVLLKAGQVPTARQKLGAIDVARLEPSFLARKRILEARVASAEGSHEKAIRQLNAAAAVRNLSPELSSEIYRVLAQAELALDNPIGAVRNLMAREQFLAGSDAVIDNQLQIWKTLNTQLRTRLAGELKMTRDKILAGWIELALATRETGGVPAHLANAVARWRNIHPEHPASDEVLRSIAAKPHELIGRFDQVALLLPLTSNYRVAAEAVRDGFMAMHAADASPGKPQITIFDIGGNPSEAGYFYEEAARRGAQFIVGPLGRDAATTIMRTTDLSLPTLLLSHIDEGAEGGHVFQFGLPPEQEARQAAERAYLDGHRQAAVLYPQSAWGERMMNAFANYWQRLGGLVLASESYIETEHDYSEPIKRLLNVVQSDERRRILETIIGRKVDFDSRPRKDIDFIFLAADAKSGRLVKPQLDFFRASQIPVYATSHIFTGKKDPVHDKDLDGIQFADMPWMLVEGGRIQKMRASLQVSWPYANTDLDRLFALGMDSYAILPHLNRISQEQAARFSGVTSGLSLDRDGRLHRQLMWARFRNGIPRLIDSLEGAMDRIAKDAKPGG